MLFQKTLALISENISNETRQSRSRSVSEPPFNLNWSYSIGALFLWKQSLRWALQLFISIAIWQPNARKCAEQRRQREWTGDVPENANDLNRPDWMKPRIQRWHHGSRFDTASMCWDPAGWGCRLKFCDTSEDQRRCKFGATLSRFLSLWTSG